MANNDVAIREVYAFARKLRGVPAALAAASNAAADEFLALVDEGFDEEKDPTGRKWRPRKTGKSGRKILHKTGKLRQSYKKVWANRNGFRVASPLDYADYTHGGTSRMVARRQVPVQSFSPKWKRRIEAAAIGALKKHFRS